ncbi:MAG: cobalamin-independent methionine synthase II family protein [Vulcanisaeta sp. AZ3]
MPEEIFTTSVVGSFPRPKWLIETFDKFNKGELSKEEFDELVDDAVKLTIKEEELTGLDVITDGEQRRTSFVSFVGQKIPGFKLVYITQLNPNALDIIKQLKAQITYWRAVPVEEIRDSVIALDEFQFTKSTTTRRIKVTLPSPYLIMWETWHHELSKQVYPRPEDLAEAYSKVLRQEIIRLRDAGVDFIQLDEPMLGDLVEATEDKPDRYRRVLELIHGQKYRGFKNELYLARDLVNETIKGIDGVRIGMHMDRWPNPDSPFYGQGFERLAPEVFDVKVKQYVLEYASPGSGDPAKFVSMMPSDKEIGLGSIDVRNPQIEDPQTVVARVERIVKVIDPKRIWINPDCGFAPGMYRKFERRIAFSKIRSMVEAARILRQKYGGE